MAEGYGIGQGAAQVFNTTDIVKYMADASYKRQQMQMKENQAMMEMFKDYDPEKKSLNTMDIPLYNEKYNKFKELYIANKGLYSNPASNIMAYKEAQSLAGDMKQIATESQQVHQLLGSLNQTYASTQGLGLSDSAIDEMKFLSSNNVKDIKSKYNGVIPSLTSFEYMPRDVDYTKVQEAIDKTVLKLNNPITSKTIPIDKYNTGIQDYVMPTFESVKNAVDVVSKERANDKLYMKDFNMADKGTFSKLESTIKEATNADFKINNYKDYAYAKEFISRKDGIKYGTLKYIKNEEAVQEAGLKNALTIEGVRHANRMAEQAQKNNLKGSKDNILLKNSEEIANLHASGQLTTNKLANYASKFGVGVGVSLKLKGATRDKVLSRINEINTKYKGTESFELPNDEQTIKSIQKYGLIELDLSGQILGSLGEQGKEIPRQHVTKTIYPIFVKEGDMYGASTNANKLFDIAGRAMSEKDKSKME